MRHPIRLEIDSLRETPIIVSEPSAIILAAGSQKLYAPPFSLPIPAGPRTDWKPPDYDINGIMQVRHTLDPTTFSYFL